MTVFGRSSWLKTLKPGDTILCKWKDRNKTPEKRIIKSIQFEAVSESGVSISTEEDPLQWLDSGWFEPFLP